MFKGLFNPENPVLRAITRLGYIWYLHILWLVCSLPLVTIGASTTALIYSCMKLRKEEGYATQNFFRSFKENFKQATAIWLIYLLVGGLIAWGMIFYNHQNNEISLFMWAVMVGVCLLFILSLMYVFAVQSRFVNTVGMTIRYSFAVAFANPKETVLMALIVLPFVVLNLISVFLINYITLSIGVGLIVYILGGHYENIFARYMPPEEGENEADPEEKETDGGQ